MSEERSEIAYNQGYEDGYKDGSAIINCRPIAYLIEYFADRGHPILDFEKAKYADNIPLYTHPEPSWQRLSDDELNQIVDKLNVSLILHCDISDFVNAIEIALKEKNGRK